MTWIDAGSLGLAWWNTSLSPPIINAGTERSAQNRGFVIEQIKELYEQHKFSILGLCEISSEDLVEMGEQLSELNLSVWDVTGTNGRLVLDTALIFDKRRLAICGSDFYIDRYGPDTLKAGTLTSFVELQTGINFQIVTSHWPGRRAMPEWAPRKAKLGNYLCSKMRQLKEESNQNYIVLMGDYNDEPFSESLASHLLATRDRTLAKSDPAFFYNPFWRHLGESTWNLGGDAEQIGVCGTHYYNKGDYSKWYTFDQILFSSEFLNDDGQVLLDDRHSQIWVNRELKEKILSASSVIDHLPIISVIKLRVRA